MATDLGAELRWAWRTWVVFVTRPRTPLGRHLAIAATMAAAGAAVVALDPLIELGREGLKRVPGDAPAAPAGFWSGPAPWMVGAGLLVAAPVHALAATAWLRDDARDWRRRRVAALWAEARAEGRAAPLRAGLARLAGEAGGDPLLIAGDARAMRAALTARRALLDEPAGARLLASLAALEAAAAAHPGPAAVREEASRALAAMDDLDRMGGTP